MATLAGKLPNVTVWGIGLCSVYLLRVLGVFALSSSLRISFVSSCDVTAGFVAFALLMGWSGCHCLHMGLVN